MLDALTAHQASSEALSSSLQKTVFNIDKSTIAGIGKSISITHSPCRFSFANDMRISKLGPQIKIGAKASLSKTTWGVPRVLSFAVAENQKSRVEVTNGKDGGIKISKNAVSNGQDALLNSLIALVKMNKAVESVEVELTPKDLVDISIGYTFEDPQGSAVAFKHEDNGRKSRLTPLLPENREVQVEYENNILRVQHIDNGRYE